MLLNLIQDLFEIIVMTVVQNIFRIEIYQNKFYFIF